MQKRPRIKVVSDTIQEFQGIRYYLCGNYFQHKCRRLHRVVWIAYRGEIPDGHHVHHRDGDTSSNRITNLKLVTPLEHRRIHGPTPGSVFTPEDHAKAAAWHGSKEGREWHREQYEKHCRPALEEEVERKCCGCGELFLTPRTPRKFCSDVCKMRSRRASGVDNELRICESCGIKYETNRYYKNRTCSRECGRRLSMSL